jgi:hypothetical protein
MWVLGKRENTLINIENFCLCVITDQENWSSKKKYHKKAKG